MFRGKHYYQMIGLAVVVAVFVFSGNVGGWLLLLWPLACLGMLVAMVWGMRGMSRSAHGSEEPSHEHGKTHSHS
jgi:hypothetical protein